MSNQFHYFASTIFEWAKAESADAAIRACAERHDADVIRVQVENGVGLKLRVCRVEAPIEQAYEIDDDYGWPEGVEISEHRVVRIIDKQGTLLPEDK